VLPAVSGLGETLAGGGGAPEPGSRFEHAPSAVHAIAAIAAVIRITSPNTTARTSSAARGRGDGQRRRLDLSSRPR
jgi:hypothetical protein